jgi:hypothetical protein
MDTVRMPCGLRTIPRCRRAHARLIVESIPDAKNWRRDHGDGIVGESFEAIEMRGMDATRVFFRLSRLNTQSVQGVDFHCEP